MKDLSRVISEHWRYRKLIADIYDKVGDNIPDIYQYGAETGFPYFTYLKDTNNFFKKHRKLIISLAKDLSKEYDERLFNFIANFKVLKGMDITDEEIAIALYDIEDESQISAIIRNAMTWFALEVVSSWFME
ncbi:MAG: hypothetical protein QW474_01155 [Candidatus Aenigmatarchaeota archaeon]